MPITFTSGLTPTFPENSFNSEKTHVKQLGVDLIAGTAFKNPLASVLTTMLARVDAVSTLLEEDRVIASAEAVTMNSYVSGTLPTGFSAAGYNDANMTSIANTATAYATANTATQAKLLTFKNYFTTADADNFKLHNELLCGLDDAPPAGIEKPTLVALMGVARSITDIENLHGIAFTNYLTGLFGALFTGDTTVANAQTHLNTDPIPTTYDSLNIVTAVNANPFSTNPAAVIGTIDPVTSSVTTYGTNVDTHKGHFTTHITTDMAYYNTVLAKIKSYIQSYQISGHIQDPYYRFMYTDVYGHDDIQQTITDFTNGDIT
tara:strand:- start:3 stop:959 length:957 start_codon:yes stop_codon:yes gene_type:complete